MPKAQFSTAIDAWRSLGLAAAELTDRARARVHLRRGPRCFSRTVAQSLVAGGDARELRCELRFLKRDGTCTWFDCTLVNLLAQADVHAVLLSAHEITAHKAIEQRLHDSERRFETVTNERLRAVTQSVPDLLLLADLDLRVQFANRPILGHSPEELIGRSILDLLPAEEREPVRAVYDRALATREPQTYELRHFIDGEVRWFENRVGSRDA